MRYTDTETRYDECSKAADARKVRLKFRKQSAVHRYKVFTIGIFAVSCGRSITKNYSMLQRFRSIFVFPSQSPFLFVRIFQAARTSMRVKWPTTVDTIVHFIPLYLIAVSIIKSRQRIDHFRSSPITIFAIVSPKHFDGR